MHQGGIESTGQEPAHSQHTHICDAAHRKIVLAQPGAAVSAAYIRVCVDNIHASLLFERLKELKGPERRKKDIHLHFDS
jgi:hypothetical protein